MSVPLARLSVVMHAHGPRLIQIGSHSGGRRREDVVVQPVPDVGNVAWPGSPIRRSASS